MAGVGLRCASAAVACIAVLYHPASANEGAYSLRSLTQSPDSPLPSKRKFLDFGDIANTPVRNRSHPGYEPAGIRAGSMMFHPALLAKVLYNSNVFAVPTGEQGDTALLISPYLTAQSDFNNHELKLDFGINHLEYADLSEESRTNAHAAASGRIDVRSDLAIAMAGKIARRHEARGTSNSPLLAAEPVPYDEYDVSTSVTKSFNRLEVSVGGAFEHRDYHDVRMVGGGTLDQDFRDGEIYVIGGRLTYKLKPGFGVFADGRYNWRHFNNLPGLNGDSEGYDLLAGAEFDITSMVHGVVGIGYLSQQYAAPGVGDATGLSYFADIIWTATPLMTVTIGGRRKVDETALATSPGRLDASGYLEIDYELRRNIIVSPSINIVYEDYTGIPREDWVVEPGLRLDYLVNRHFSVGARYVYTSRDSNVSVNDFDRHIVGIHAKAQF